MAKKQRLKLIRPKRHVAQAAKMPANWKSKAVRWAAVGLITGGLAVGGHRIAKEVRFNSWRSNTELRLAFSKHDDPARARFYEDEISKAVAKGKPFHFFVWENLESVKGGRQKEESKINSALAECRRLR